jgi:cell division protein FtsI/penicillin-binding protein 2
MVPVPHSFKAFLLEDHTVLQYDRCVLFLFHLIVWRRNMKIRIFPMFSIFFVIFIISGCSEKPKPADQFQNYVTSWQEEDFTNMYAVLSQSAKSSISEADFISRYQKIYGDFEVNDLQVIFEPPTEEDADSNEDGEASFPYTVKMNTFAGPVEFSHQATLVQEEKEDEENWYVNWDPSMIFPDLEEEDRILAYTIKAERGEIVDRDGNGLAVNGKVREIGIVPERLSDDPAKTKQELAKILNITVDEIDNKLNASWVQPHLYVPIKKIAKDETDTIQRLIELPGVTTKEVGSRVYPYKEAMAHLTGYIRPITAEKLEELEDKGYDRTDVVGERGLEQLFEDRLRGQNGAVIYIEDSDGNEKATIANKEPVNGETIKLTIDAEMQRGIYNELGNDAGTAVALHPKTGEVLAAVNSPSFNPNSFVLGLSSEQWQTWNKDPQKPLLNRFNQTYSPGSTFKPVTAAIGLETGAITPDKTRQVPEDNMWQKDSSWGDYFVNRVPNPKTQINLRDALVYSDNIYFAQTALEIGGENFQEGAKKFGVGEELPSQYPFKISTLTNEKNFTSETLLADTGYGQGQVSMSPLHLGLTYTALLNNGDIVSPKLFVGAEDERNVWKDDAVSPENASIILEDLVQVIEDPKGTGADAKIGGLTLAGKTGTAEMKQKQGEKGRENGWFVAFDVEEPELLVAMMIENVREREGSHYVIPKVKRIFERFVANE